MHVAHFINLYFSCVIQFACSSLLQLLVSFIYEAISLYGWKTNDLVLKTQFPQLINYIFPL